MDVTLGPLHGPHMTPGLERERERERETDRGGKVERERGREKERDREREAGERVYSRAIYILSLGLKCCTKTLGGDRDSAILPKLRL